MVRTIGLEKREIRIRRRKKLTYPKSAFKVILRNVAPPSEFRVSAKSTFLVIDMNYMYRVGGKH